MAQQFCFQKILFANLDIPDLLINIWEYNDNYHKNCVICGQYGKWCVEIARSKWQPYFKAFSFVIGQIQIQNKNFFAFETSVLLIKTICIKSSGNELFE